MKLYSEIKEQDINIYDNLKWLQPDSCMQSILQYNFQNAKNVCNKSVDSITPNSIKINDEWNLIFNKSTTIITCEQTTQYYQETALLFNTVVPNCIIECGTIKTGKISRKRRFSRNN